MITDTSCNRDKDPTSSSNTEHYVAAHFHRLTNRSTSSPHSTPDFAQEPPAEYSSYGRTVNFSDKRASNTHLASEILRKAPESRQSSAIRKGSWPSVKEEEAGKLQNLPR